MLPSKKSLARRTFLQATGSLALAACFTSKQLWAQGAEPKKIAFLVGVAKYQKDGLRDLDYAEDDARELADELTKQGFKVTLVVGNDANLATLQTKLGDFFQSLKTLSKSDVVLISFSGHGQQTIVSENGRAVEAPFFCPVDTLKTDPKTLLSLNWIMERVKEDSASSQNLMLVDACRDNPAKGTKGVDGSTVTGLPNKLSVLFSSSAGTQSYEAKAVKHGIFTHVLLKGLRGEAANRQGQVTWLTLASHVMNEVPAQTPELLGDPQADQRPNLLGNLVVQPILARILERPPMPPMPQLGRVAAEQRDDNGLRLKLIWCPGGSFKMGEDAGAVNVTLSQGFWLGKYEVTQGEWKQVMGTTPWKGESNVKEDANHAASYINYTEALEFCRKLTEIERKALRLSDREEYTLPTEAQWEFACRAESTTKYYFGNDEAELSDYAWWGGLVGEGNTQKEQYAHAVGLKKPNRWRLHDMHGNVYEWCLDRYQEKLPGGRDPIATGDGDFFVLRGGSWGNYAKFSRSANRNGLAPSSRLNMSGFRIACVVR